MHIKPQTSKIKNRAGVIDVIAQDSNTGEAVLVMHGTGGSSQQFSRKQFADTLFRPQWTACYTL